MSSAAQQQNPWAHELDELMRGAAGGFLFSVPLLYTMEVWWIGSFATPARMLAALAVACVLVFMLTLTGGFRDDEAGKLGDTLIETVQAVGFSLLFSAAILVLLRRVTLETPLDEALGKIVFEALPFAVGMALGNEILNKDRDGEGSEEDEGGADEGQGQRSNGTLKDLGASAIGAAFIAFTIAPTEEVPMLAAALGPPWLLALIVASLAISYIVVFESGFADQAGRHKHEGLLQSPPSETIASYLVALAVAAAMLVLFGQVSLADPWTLWLSYTLVLGLPAAVGGAAGRLAV